MARVTGPIVLLGGLLAAGAGIAALRLLANRDSFTAAIPKHDPVRRIPEPARPATKLETAIEQATRRTIPPTEELVREAETEDPDILRMRTCMLAWKDSEHWEKRYEALSIDELTGEHVRIERTISEVRKSQLEWRCDRGIGQWVEAWPGRPRPHNPYEVCLLKGRWNGPWMKCTLPEDEFPEVYKQKALSVWLSSEIDKRSRIVAR